MQKLALTLFLLGLFVTGLLGTETRLLFFWPGCALIGLAGGLAVLRWKLRVLFRPSDVCLLTVLLLSAYVGWRAWASPVEVYAREDAAVLLACFVAYLMTVTAASHPKWRMGIVCVLLVLAAGNLTAGWLNFKGRWDFHLVPGFSRAFEPGRIGGFFNNPNHLAAFLSFTVLLSSSVMLFARIHIASRLLLGFGILAMLAGVGLTLSRGAMLGIGVGGVVFILLALTVVWQTRRPLFKWLLLGVLVIVGGLGGALYKVNEESLVKRQLGSPLSEDVRIHIWRAALAQNAESPLTGAGSRMFYEEGIRLRDPESSPQLPDSLFAHNEYLQMLADYGWAGMVLMALVLITHFANGFRFLRWFAAEKFLATGRLVSNSLALALGGIAALVATLVHAAFEFHGHVPAIAILGAIVLGVLANPGAESESLNPRRVWGLRFLMKVVMLAASTAMIAGAVVFGVPDAQAAMARLQAKRGENELALRNLDRATESDPRNAELAYQHGLALVDSIKPGMKKEAYLRTLDRSVIELSRAVALNPFSYKYQLALADVLDASGKHDLALEAIQKALIQAPLYEEPRLALGMHLHRLGKFEEAEFAYIWARDAKALNRQGLTNWQDNHRQLLRHTAILAERQRKALQDAQSR